MFLHSVHRIQAQHSRSDQVELELGHQLLGCGVLLRLAACALLVGGLAGCSGDGESDETDAKAKSSLEAVCRSLADRAESISCLGGRSKDAMIAECSGPKPSAPDSAKCDSAFLELTKCMDQASSTCDEGVVVNPGCAAKKTEAGKACGISDEEEEELADGEGGGE